MSRDLKGKTIVITGASRGIGREIGLRCARDGANVVIGAKTAEPHAKLPGTIFSVAEEVEAAGGKALALQTDVRLEDEVRRLMEAAAQKFGGIDILVNNAGFIRLTSAEETSVKNYDLMMAINARAVFVCTQAALPHLKQAENPHVLNLSPPVSLDPKWLGPHIAYTLSKYGMTLQTMGMAEEFRKYGIAVNSLWPRTLIATAAIPFIIGEEAMKQTRKPSMMADAAYAIFTTMALRLTGQALIDEDVLREHGVKDFDRYATHPGSPLLPDLFME